MPESQKKPKPTSQELRRRIHQVLGDSRPGEEEEEERPLVSRDEIMRLIQDLETHQIELQMQNEELRRLNVELEESREVYSELYNNAPVGYLTVDPSGLIVRANQTASQMLEKPYHAIYGSHMLRFVEREDHQTYLASVRQCIDHRRPVGFEVRIRTQSGLPLYARIDMDTSTTGEGKFEGWRLTLVDITARRDAEERRRGHLRRAEQLIRLAKEILAETSRKALLQRVAVAVRQTTGARASACAYNYHGSEFLVSAFSGAESTADYPLERVVKAHSRNIYREVLETGESIRLTDDQMHGDATWRTRVEGHPPPRGILAAPLITADSQTFGMILLTDKEEGEFTAEDQTLVDQLAAIASLGLHHIDARKQAERRAAEASEGKRLLDAIMEHIPEGLNIADAPDGTVRMMSRHGLEMLGLSRKDIEGRPVGEHLDGWEILRNDGGQLKPVTVDELPLKRAIAGGEVTKNEEIVMRRPGQQEIHLSCNAGPIRDENGAIMAGIIGWHDVTEHKRAEEALRNSEQKYRALFDAMAQGAIYSDSNLEALDVNQSAERILGLTAEQIRQRKPTDPGWQAIREDGSKLEDREQPILRAMKYGKPVWNVTVGVFNPEKKRHRWLSVSSIPLFKPDGEKPAAVYTTFSDITDLKAAKEELQKYSSELERRVRKRTEKLVRVNEKLTRQINKRVVAEESLRKSESLLRKVLETLPVGVWVVDRDGRIYDCNPAAERIWKGADYVGIDGYDRYKGWWADSGKPIEAGDWAAARAVTRGETSIDELIEIECFDGSHKIIRNSAAPLFDAEDRILGAIIVNQDVTDRVAAEQSLRESEARLRALSKQLLTAQEEERKRVARELHDSIGSSLSAIKFRLSYLMDQVPIRSKTRSLLNELVGLVTQSIEDSRRIMAALRPAVLDDLGLLAAVQWFCKQFESLYGNIRVSRTMSVEEADVAEHFRVVIFRIVQESMNNAAKHSEAKKIHVSLGKKNNHIELRVEDDGKGFEVGSAFPASDHSTGLGINGMRERAELSGGTFSILSTPGRGTLIRASWPAASATVDPGEQE